MQRAQLEHLLRASAGITGGREFVVIGSQAVLPLGWRDRLVPVRTQGTGDGIGLCLEVHDLAISKLVAGREKDLKFLGGLVRHALVTAPTLRERLEQTGLDPERRRACEARLDAALRP